MRVSPLSPATTDGANLKSDLVKKPNSGSFMNELKSKIQEVNQLQNLSDQAMSEGSVKGAANIHETMIQVEEADLSLRFLTKVRNKALDAYHEIMRMQF